MIADTGGGILHEPHDPAALADAVRRMMSEPDLAARSGRDAQRRIHQEYHAAAMAHRTVAAYATVTSAGNARPLVDSPPP
jgi:glycosyltransferase involved in cell wall biosynthesis